jgi:hypothetical protein
METIPGSPGFRLGPAARVQRRELARPERQRLKTKQRKRQCMNENTTTQVGGYIGMLALGALIGAAAAMLYAPRSGKDTREYLARRARDLKDKAGDVLDDAKEMIVGRKEELKAHVSSRG